MRPFSREIKVVSTLVRRANLPGWAKEYADEKIRKAQWYRDDAKDARYRLIRLDLYAKAMSGLIDVRELVLFYSTGRNPYEPPATD